MSSGNLRLQAEVLGNALALELIEPFHVLAWADSIIATSDPAEPTILAISVDALGERFDRLDAMEALSRVSGETTGEDVANALLGVLGRWLDADPSPAIAWKISSAVHTIVEGFHEAPFGAHLEIDDERNPAYGPVDRLISRSDVAEWRSALANFLLANKRHAAGVWFPY